MMSISDKEPTPLTIRDVQWPFPEYVLYPKGPDLSVLELVRNRLRAGEAAFVIENLCRFCDMGEDDFRAYYRGAFPRGGEPSKALLEVLPKLRERWHGWIDLCQAVSDYNQGIFGNVKGWDLELTFRENRRAEGTE